MEFKQILQSKYISSYIFQLIKDSHRREGKKVLNYHSIANSRNLFTYIRYGFNKLFIDSLNSLTSRHKDFLGIPYEHSTDANLLSLYDMLLYAIEFRNYELVEFIIDVSNKSNGLISLVQPGSKLPDFNDLKILVSITKVFSPSQISEMIYGCDDWKDYNQSEQDIRDGKDSIYTIKIIEYLKQNKISTKLFNINSLDTLKWANEEPSIFQPSTFSLSLLYYARKNNTDAVKYLLNHDIARNEIIENVTLHDFFISNKNPSLDTMRCIFSNGLPLAKIQLSDHIFKDIIQYGSIDLIAYLFLDPDNYDLLAKRSRLKRKSYFRMFGIANPSIALLEKIAPNSTFNINILESDLCKDFSLLEWVVSRPDIITRFNLDNLIKFKNLVEWGIKSDNLPFIKYLISKSSTTKTEATPIVSEYIKPYFKLLTDVHHGYQLNYSKDYLEILELTSKFWDLTLNGGIVMRDARNSNCPVQVYELIEKKYPNAKEQLYSISTFSTDSIDFFHHPDIPIDSLQLDKIDKDDKCYLDGMDYIRSITGSKEPTSEPPKVDPSKTILYCNSIMLFGQQLDKLKYFWMANPDDIPMPFEFKERNPISLEVAQFLYEKFNSQYGSRWVDHSTLIYCHQKSVFTFVMITILDSKSKILNPFLLFKQATILECFDVADLLYPMIESKNELVGFYMEQYNKCEMKNHLFLNNYPPADLALNYIGVKLQKEGIELQNTLTNKFILDQYCKTFNLGLIGIVDHYKELFERKKYYW